MGKEWNEIAQVWMFTTTPILTLLKGAKIELGCRAFEPKAAHCIREAPNGGRELQNSSGRSSKIPDAAGTSKIRMAQFPPICHSVCIRVRIVY